MPGSPDVNPAFEATATFASPFAPRSAAASSPSGAPAWLRALFEALRRTPAQACDRSTGLYHRSGLFAAANEIIQARVSPGAVCMVVVEFADLREVCDIYGTAIARKVVAKLVRRLRVAAGWRGLVGRTGPA